MKRLPANRTIRRRGTGLKLGRNDLCWCGSGKKYKFCHLREDEAENRKTLRAFNGMG